METKKCKQCLQELPVGSFYSHHSTKDKLLSICKSCHGANAKARREADPFFREKAKGYMQKFRSQDKNKSSERSSRYKQKYGITLEEYEVLLEQQHNKCFICDTEHADSKPLYVDHCHKTGTVRKLLCQHCNTGLGMFRDNPELLTKAADYLKEHNGNLLGTASVAD